MFGRLMNFAECNPVMRTRRILTFGAINHVHDNAKDWVGGVKNLPETLVLSEARGESLLSRSSLRPC